jgi:hypothetical protein
MPMWPWRKAKPNPKETMRDLREQALTRSASQLGLSPLPDRPHVFGILMETGYGEGVASLVAFAEGSTSLYFSNGGGIIGAGEHAPVRTALPPFFAAAEARRTSFAPAASTPLPDHGRVRFYLRTFEGTLTAEAGEEDLGHMKHDLSPLFHAGHAVIAAVRQASGG